LGVKASRRHISQVAARLESWYRDSQSAPHSVMEIQSYHAMVACVAGGGGVAVNNQILQRLNVGRKGVAAPHQPGGRVAPGRRQAVLRRPLSKRYFLSNHDITGRGIA
jgi:DNA-binding transcriptional LysR family regulator